jgi:hypothetical protein
LFRHGVQITAVIIAVYVSRQIAAQPADKKPLIDDALEVGLVWL